MTNLTAREIAIKMGGRVESDSALVPGPGHSSADRSLSVKPDPTARDGFVTHSFAGDDFAECRDHVRNKLGLPYEPRSSTTPHEQRGRIVATYPYYDEHGRLLYEVVRFGPKDFRQRRPDGHGGWIWKLEDTRRVPYRLRELRTAVAAGRIVTLVEGEKDADAVRAKIGLDATTLPGGAGKWRPEYADHFRSADVVIIPDNDVPGRSHARDIAAALSSVAKCVRTLDLAACWPGCPEKGDISDWIAAGGTREQLDRLISGAPTFGQDNPKSVSTLPWPVMAPEAYYGLAGDVVNTIKPHSEADPNALLLQFLALAGNIIGRLPYYQVESAHHHANLFTVLVGASAKARKGTSFERVRAVVKIADETWAGDRLKGGLASGEGLINEVRDPVQRWNAKEKIMETVDPGVNDKRLMAVEPEFASVVSVGERQGNTLTQLIRRAWDGDKLQTLTRSSPLCATGAHISIVGHITEDELRARLTRTDLANGFANRFLFALVKRSQLLPFGGDLPDAEIQRLGRRLAAILEKVRSFGRISMVPRVKSVWEPVYASLSEDQPGLLGAVTARGEAQTVRLALLYALLDGSNEIDVPHLKAALAVWEYCEASAAHIFGSALGDPIADDILRALQHAGATGMSRTAIRDLFGRNQSADRIGAALALLLTKGRARTTRVEGGDAGGRPAEIWSATSGANNG